MAKILIADDAAFMRMMLKDILEKNGHEIIGEAEHHQRIIFGFKEYEGQSCHSYES